MVLSIQRPSNANTKENYRSNLLLDLLTQPELQRLLVDSQRAIIPAKTMLYQPQKAIEQIYFPLRGIISLMNICEAGLISESAVVSNEGMVSIGAVLGHNFTSNFVVAQTKCSAIAISLYIVKQEFNRGQKFQQVLLLYSQARLAQAYQNVFCSCHHTIEQRLARWLIYYSDCALTPKGTSQSVRRNTATHKASRRYRLKTRDILLTQETLADLIGVRRSSLSVVAADLRQRKLIDYNRGKIKITNLKALKAVACSCNSVILEDYSRLLLGRS